MYQGTAYGSYHSFGSSKPDLPSFAGDGSHYSKTYKPRKAKTSWEQLQGAPVIRLLLGLVAIALLLFTFSSGARSSAGGWVSRRTALEEESASDGRLDEERLFEGQEQQHEQHEQQQQQQEPHHHHQQQQQHREVHAPGSQQWAGGGASGGAGKHGGRGFNPLLHQLYLDLPVLREATPYTLRGGWQLTKPVYDYAVNHPAAEVLSWERPRLMLFRSFLSPEEVDHVVAASTPHLVRSEVLKDVSGGTTGVDEARTSMGAWPPADDVLLRIQDRIHRLTGIPQEFGEPIHVLKYELMAQYMHHNDHCMDGYDGRKEADKPCLAFLERARGPDCGPGAGGPSCGDRVATFILYLKSPTRGGSTVFPAAEATEKRLKALGKQLGIDGSWYCQDDVKDEVLSVQPGAGDGVLFWDYAPAPHGTGRGSYRNGTANPTATAVYEALHSGCPVLEGQKWIATRWIRSSGFDLLQEEGQQQQQ